MFGWFSPKCPVGTWEKAWTEIRMCWLASQFGLERLANAEVILPTDDYFPEPYDGTVKDVQRMLNRLCGYLRIDPQRVRLAIVADTRMPGAAGLYEQSDDPQKKALIRVAKSQLADPQALVATLAHELAHELLLGGGLLDPLVSDHEWVTDLLPVFFGIGIFAANSSLHEQYHSDGNGSWWVIGKQGYLPARVFGYAMALFAFARGEEDPPWVKHLRRDASTAVRAGLRYLNKTGDSLFPADTHFTGGKSLTPAEAVTRLRTGSPSARLAALWEIQKEHFTDPECLAAVADCLEYADQAVPGEAARTLADFGIAAAPTVPRLRAALFADSADTRAGAAYALGRLRLQPDAVAPELCSLLADHESFVYSAALEALAELGGRVGDKDMRRLMDRLETALVMEQELPALGVARALVAVTDDPERCVREYFAGRDDALVQAALEVLTQERTALDEKAGDT